MCAISPKALEPIRVSVPEAQSTGEVADVGRVGPVDVRPVDRSVLLALVFGSIVSKAATSAAAKTATPAAARARRFAEELLMRDPVVDRGGRSGGGAESSGDASTKNGFTGSTEQEAFAEKPIV